MGLLGPQEKGGGLSEVLEATNIVFCWEKDHWGPGRIEEEIFGVLGQSMMGHWVSRGKEGK